MICFRIYRDTLIVTLLTALTCIGHATSDFLNFTFHISTCIFHFYMICIFPFNTLPGHDKQTERARPGYDINPTLLEKINTCTSWPANLKQKFTGQSVGNKEWWSSIKQQQGFSPDNSIPPLSTPDGSVVTHEKSTIIDCSLLHQDVSR